MAVHRTPHPRTERAGPTQQTAPAREVPHHLHVARPGRQGVEEAGVRPLQLLPRRRVPARGGGWGVGEVWGRGPAFQCGRPEQEVTNSWGMGRAT